ncbi:hypothetical protein BYT27DRAFT_6867697 [Phlegmacium glaucopus]|nr:hypothetical protein BYT27DRAFT_6867697 [Phlegmacium glaucopus]
MVNPLFLLKNAVVFAIVAPSSHSNEANSLYTPAQRRLELRVGQESIKILIRKSRFTKNLIAKIGLATVNY